MTGTALMELPKALAPALAERGIDPQQWGALKNIWPGAKDESVLSARDYCVARKLDPLKKPVHIVPMYVDDKQTGQKGMRDVIMPGIYELRTTAFRTGDYAGQDDPVFGPVMGFEGIDVPEWCRVTVYRMIHGQRCAFSHTAYYEEEYATKDRNSTAPNSMWRKRKRGQLAKVAEAGALRKAFPEELGGEMTMEEMAGKAMDVTGDSNASPVRTAADTLNEKLSPQPPTIEAEATEETPEPEAAAQEPEPEAEGADYQPAIDDFKSEIEAATTRAQLDTIGKALVAQPREVQEAVRATYQAKGKALTEAAKGGKGKG